MLRSAIFAVLAIALSSSPVLARQVAVASASLVISAEAALVAPSTPGLVAFATPVAPELGMAKPRNAPLWATALAVAGPLADGLTTVYAMHQSGPNARVAEGNGFYQKLFGSDVKAGEIMAFKFGQAALWGAIVHSAGRKERKAAIGVAVLTAGINFFVASRNMQSAATARRLNVGAR